MIGADRLEVDGPDGTAPAPGLMSRKVEPMNFKSRLVKLGRLASAHGRAELRLVLECAQVGTDGADGLPLGFHRGHPGVQLVHAGPEPTEEEIALANPYVGPSTLLIILGPSHVDPPDFPAA